MDQVDRKASTKEFEEEGIVNQECVTVESTDGMEYFAKFPTHCSVFPSSCHSLTVAEKYLAEGLVFGPQTINLSDKLNSLNPWLQKLMKFIILRLNGNNIHGSTFELKRKTLAVFEQFIGDFYQLLCLKMIISSCLYSATTHTHNLCLL